MDEERTLIDIWCESENTQDCIGCRIEVPPTANEIVINNDKLEDILLTLEESFFELIDEFESSAQKAFDNGEISGTDRDELFKVFGHFHFSCTADGEPVNINLGIDPDEYMYPLLVEYLEINME